MISWLFWNHDLESELHVIFIENNVISTIRSVSFQLKNISQWFNIWKKKMYQKHIFQRWLLIDGAVWDL